MINLIHGDCLERMKGIPDNSIDLVLTDPPYGTTACKWDTVIPFEPMWEQLKRITKDNAAICLFGSEPFSSHLRMSNIKMFKYDWYWNKVRATGAICSKKRPMSKIELISVFRYGKLKYFPQMEKMEKPRISKNYKASESYKFGTFSETKASVITHKHPTTLIKFSNASNKGRLHPTQKPVALLEYLIKTYTLKNETVLDFTMGSGSTGVACKNLNRNFIGIEKEKKYYDMARERIGD